MSPMTRHLVFQGADSTLVLCCHLGAIGLIGSATKWATFRHRLGARGYTDAELSQVQCPIGLPGIRGKEPEVIAVARYVAPPLEEEGSAQVIEQLALVLGTTFAAIAPVIGDVAAVFVDTLGAILPVISEVATVLAGTFADWQIGVITTDPTEQGALQPLAIESFPIFSAGARTVQLTGSGAEVNAFLAEISATARVLELVRSGTAALERGVSVLAAPV